MPITRRRLLLSALGAAALGAACSTPRGARVRWEPVFAGVELTRWQLAEPRPVRMVLARIDVRVAGVQLVTTPPAGVAGAETLGVFTSTFARQQRLQLAINAAPFDLVVDEEGRAMDVAGLHVSDGVVVSGQSKQYPALCFDRAGRGWLARPPFALDGVRHAVGGFDIVLEGGRTTAEALRGGVAAQLHPRTAVGLLDGGWRMIWMVVDGRQPGVSEGATLPDLAGWFRELGADDAINLDGGGTTAMVREVDRGRVELLNRPIHGGVPGRERPAGSHLGLRALPHAR